MVRKGSTIAQTRAINREAEAGLISTIERCAGGRKFQALLVAREAGREKKVPDCLGKEAEREPMSYSAARSSKHSDAGIEAME